MKINFEGKWLLNMGQFTIKMNIWDCRILIFMDRWLLDRADQRFDSYLIFSTWQLFELALTVSVLYYGGHLVMDGTLTGGTLISFILYQIQLGDSINVSKCLVLRIAYY